MARNFQTNGLWSQMRRKQVRSKEMRWLLPRRLRTLPLLQCFVSCSASHMNCTNNSSLQSYAEGSVAGIPKEAPFFF